MVIIKRRLHGNYGGSTGYHYFYVAVFLTMVKLIHSTEETNTAKENNKRTVLIIISIGI